MDKVTVALKYPIEAHGETVKSLTFSEPDLGLLDDIEIQVKGDGSVRLNLGDLHKIVANLANIPPSSAKKIKVSDMAEVGKAVMGFFKGFPLTGGS